MSKEFSTIGTRHGFSEDAMREAVRALQSGFGRQAQFSHPELGGTWQWSGGMIMIGDMFNQPLKARVAALFTELSQHTAAESRGPGNASFAYERSTESSHWYPAALGIPSTSGAQEGLRYAFFPSTQRLAIEHDGRVTVYDTGEHSIGGVAQAQSSSRGTITFTSQLGVVSLDSLPKVANG